MLLWRCYFKKKCVYCGLDIICHGGYPYAFYIFVKNFPKLDKIKTIYNLLGSESVIVHTNYNVSFILLN